MTSPTSTPTGSPPPTSSTPVTDAVGAFVAGAATARFDDHVREPARRHVLDTVASIVARQGFEHAQSLDRMHGDERIAARMATVEVVHDPAQETGTGRAREVVGACRHRDHLADAGDLVALLRT